MLLFGSGTLKIGGGVMVKDLCPMHMFPFASPPPPSLTGSCAELRNSWVFEKLEFPRHIDGLAKTEGGFSCPRVWLSERKKEPPLNETVTSRYELRLWFTY